MADSQRKSYNLFDSTTLQNNTGIGADGLPYPYNNRIASYTPVNISSNAVTLSFVGDARGIYSLFDETDTLITRTANVTSGTTIDTTGAVKMYLCFYNNNATVTTDNVTDVMLNTGSTAKPYEPYGWVHSLRKLTTATETVETPLYSDGTAITAYTIKGNTVQNGTPTPSNPITISGVGNKTANLLPPPTAAASVEINGITYNVSADGVCTFSGTASASVNITVDLSKQFVIPYSTPAGGQGTVAFNNTKALNAVVMFYNGNTQVDAWQLNVVNRTHTSYSSMAGKTIDRYIIQIPSGVNADGLTVAVAFSDNGVPVSPFEPYGQYKIPISSGGVTTNIYLGSVQSTRRIKKIVFDGTEDFQRVSISGNLAVFVYTLSEPAYRANSADVISTHYVGSTSATAGNIYIASSNTRLGIVDEFSSTSAFQSYLQQQYAAGTPVTVWYVLATEETAIVNEPLMKIDTYADTLSNAAQIPTTEGANSITVDTTVQPSEFTATWTGWHDSSVKEYDGTDWQ